RNLTPSQPLFARISNRANCITIVPFELLVSSTRASNAVIERCDENLDGFMSFNLQEANVQLLAEQAIDIEISYYSTPEGALLEDAQFLLNNIFKNTSPYNQVVYARLENDNACYALSEIE